MSTVNKGRGHWTVCAGRRIYDVVGARVVERQKGNCILRYLVGWLADVRTRFEACLGVTRRRPAFYLPRVPRFLSPSTAAAATTG
jgi:hypothetical protein